MQYKNAFKMYCGLKIAAFKDFQKAIPINIVIGFSRSFKTLHTVWLETRLLILYPFMCYTHNIMLVY